LWENRWLGDGSLKRKFSRLFSISYCREAKLRQAEGWNNNVEWFWRRSLFDSEKQMEQELVRMLGTKSITEGKEDKWVWKVSDVAEFIVQSTYRVLRSDGQEEGVAMYEDFWRIKAKPSAYITTWRVLENKITSK